MMLYIRFFLWNLVQLDMKDVEDETIESRSQTVTQPTDSRNHTLTHTYRNKSLQSALKNNPASVTSYNSGKPTLLIRIGCAGNQGANSRERDTRHGGNSSSCPHHPGDRKRCVGHFISKESLVVTLFLKLQFNHIFYFFLYSC